MFFLSFKVCLHAVYWRMYFCSFDCWILGLHLVALMIVLVAYCRWFCFVFVVLCLDVLYVVLMLIVVIACLNVCFVCWSLCFALWFVLLCLCGFFNCAAGLWFCMHIAASLVMLVDLFVFICCLLSF